MPTGCRTRRCEAGIVAAARGATSMIDVSDGLLADLGHIADASGVTINVLTAPLPVNPRLVEVASALGRDHLEWALTGGDDHALAATFPARRAAAAGLDRHRLGRRGNGVAVDGEPWPGHGGWDHFR